MNGEKLIELKITFNQLIQLHTNLSDKDSTLHLYLEAKINENNHEIKKTDYVKLENQCLEDGDDYNGRVVDGRFSCVFAQLSEVLKNSVKY